MEKKKNFSLEESLRTEMMNSEEQRTYIEILKIELEKKMIDNGFLNFFKTQNTAPGMSHIDIYLELNSIKNKLIERDK